MGWMVEDHPIPFLGFTFGTTKKKLTV